MKLVRSLGLAFLLMASLVPAALAQTGGGKTADTAIQLTSAASQTGTLIGSNAGAYAYYWIDYPGGSVDATITYYFSPTDAPLERSFGVTVWEGPRRLAFNTGSGPIKGSHTLTFFSKKEQRLLVQVGNYLTNREASYTLQLTGIEPEGETVTPAAAPVAAPAPAAAAPQAQASGDGKTPETAIAFTDVATGSLVGDSSGAYAHYWVENRPGKTGHFQLDFAPSDSTTSRAVAIEVWQGHNRLASNNGGASTDKGAVKTFFTSHAAGPLLVKVNNYRTGVEVGYKLLLTWT